ncbi:MAG: ATP-binding cassette domain-containing protein, partial [Acidimicrobiales bacterium]
PPARWVRYEAPVVQDLTLSEAARLAAFYRAWPDLIDEELEGTPHLGPPALESELPFMTDRAQALRASVGGGIIPVAVAAVLASAGMVGAAAALWVDRKQRELALLVARGVGPGAIGVKAALEHSSAIVVGTLAGFGAAYAAVDGIDVEFPDGRVTAIAGPSGSGKSSLLRILAGLQAPTSGTVEIGGRLISRMGARRARRVRRRLIGYVFQRPSDNLLPYLSSREQIEFAARIRGAGAGEADGLLETLGIAHRADAMPGELSGGEQARLALAAAVVGRPAVVLADEPTAQLDDRSETQVVAALRSLTDQGVAVVVATHDAAVVDAADRVLRIHTGRIDRVEDRRR